MRAARPSVDRAQIEFEGVEKKLTKQTGVTRAHFGDAEHGQIDRRGLFSQTRTKKNAEGHGVTDRTAEQNHRREDR